jgi:hypothetical protein
MTTFAPHPRLRAAAVAALLVLGTARPGAAAGTTVSIDQLSSLVAGMGLDDVGDKKTFVRVENQGKSAATVTMNPVDDGRFVAFYTSLGPVPADKMAAMPMKTMLEHDDSSAFYFTLGSGDPQTLYLQDRIDSATVSAKVLRERIDAMLDEVETTRDLWDQDKWTAPATVPLSAKTAEAGLGGTDNGYAALSAKADAAWEQAPLAANVMTFTKGEQKEPGHFIPLGVSTFHTGDTAYLYVQPVGFAWKTEVDGSVSSGVGLDLVLKTAAGDVLMDAKNIVAKPYATWGKPHIVSLRPHVLLGGDKPLPPGDYTFMLTLHDLFGPKVAAMSMPFKIVN